jgi:hypothetical protein
MKMRYEQPIEFTWDDGDMECRVCADLDDGYIDIETSVKGGLYPNCMFMTLTEATALRDALTREIEKLATVRVA